MASLPPTPAPLRGNCFASDWQVFFWAGIGDNPMALQKPKPLEINPIRIYVACLAAYNNGSLHGRWIDATLGENHIHTQVKAMLANSSEPNAEEWAIHDYEGFEDAPISEWDSFERIANLAEFITEHETLGGKLLEHFGGDLEDAKTAFDNYWGEFENLEEYARSLTEDVGMEIPTQLENYIDYAAMGRDMELSGDIFTVEITFDEIHIFGTA
jgi:antirestriction protein